MGGTTPDAPLGETTPDTPLGETPRPHWLPKTALAPQDRTGSLLTVDHKLT
ncbi:hypothetical protein JYQ62_23000 [Nostoc sp. UHCC 0702]|nr:hypothetical protein JYQ62_23000 [Nostoc sp. UHCC 0702]